MYKNTDTFTGVILNLKLVFVNSVVLEIIVRGICENNFS